MQLNSKILEQLVWSVLERLDGLVACCYIVLSSVKLIK